MLDLQGVWTNASVTTLERPAGISKLVLTPQEAAQMEKAMAAMLARNDQESKAPPTAGGNPGGYNSFWLDPGTKVGMVNGEYRSSWVVDPPNGHVPYSDRGAAANGDPGPRAGSPASTIRRAARWASVASSAMARPAGRRC